MSLPLLSLKDTPDTGVLFHPVNWEKDPVEVIIKKLNTGMTHDMWGPDYSTYQDYERTDGEPLLQWVISFWRDHFDISAWHNAYKRRGGHCNYGMDKSRLNPLRGGGLVQQTAEIFGATQLAMSCLTDPTKTRAEHYSHRHNLVWTLYNNPEGNVNQSLFYVVEAMAGGNFRRALWIAWVLLLFGAHPIGFMSSANFFELEEQWKLIYPIATRVPRPNQLIPSYHGGRFYNVLKEPVEPETQVTMILRDTAPYYGFGTWAARLVADTLRKHNSDAHPTFQLTGTTHAVLLYLKEMFDFVFTMSHVKYNFRAFDSQPPFAMDALPDPRPFWAPLVDKRWREVREQPFVLDINPGPHVYEKTLTYDIVWLPSFEDDTVTVWRFADTDPPRLVREGNHIGINNRMDLQSWPEDRDQVFEEYAAWRLVRHEWERWRGF